MYMLITCFIAVVAVFAIGVYVWAMVNPGRAPKSTVITMPTLAIFCIVTLILWGAVPPPAP